MAVSLAVFGENGPFYVVPVVGRAPVVVAPTCSARMRPAAERSARSRRCLLLASPVFLTHLMVPMSDFQRPPGWTLVAVLVLKQRPLAAGDRVGPDAAHPPESHAAGVGAGRSHGSRNGSRSFAMPLASCPGCWRSWSSTRFCTAGRCRLATGRCSSCMRWARCRSTCATTSSGWCRRRRRSSCSRSCRCWCRSAAR